MRIVVFGPGRRVGVLHDDRVFDVDATVAAWARDDAARRARGGEPGRWSGLSAFIEAGDAALDTTEDALGWAVDRDDIELGGGPILAQPVDGVILHAPLADAGALIFNTGANYAEHVQRGRAVRGRVRTVEETEAELRAAGEFFFVKLGRNVIPTGGTVPFPRRARLLDYEGEVVVVLGRRAVDVAPQDLGDHVWGYTLQLDMSIRDISDMSRIGYLKNFRGSAPLGPAIAVREYASPSEVPFETRVNGELRQRGSTADMVFSFGEMLAYVSADQECRPGDMISGGTCPGTAIESARVGPDGVVDDSTFLHPGDVVEVSSPAIGTLRTTVSASA